MKVGLFFDCGQPLLKISVHSFLIYPCMWLLLMNKQVIKYAFLQTLKDVEPYMNELFQELQNTHAKLEVGCFLRTWLN